MILAGAQRQQLGTHTLDFPGTGVAAEPSLSLAEDPLVVPGVQALDQAQQSGEHLAALRASPQAVAARSASRTRFEGVSGREAGAIASRAFPTAIDAPDAGPPPIPAGAHLAGYVGPHAAVIRLSNGQPLLAESIEPLAVQTSVGHYAPIDLQLQGDGSTVKPVRPATPATLPLNLRDGVSLPRSGVTITPLDIAGAAQGAIRGASVIYPNTAIDSDSLVKPTAGGVDVGTLLRSIRSPQSLYFHVGLPAGAAIRPIPHGQGAEITDGGRTLATIAPPTAADALGTAVPVAMSISGRTLIVSVRHRSGSYTYPIMVDPTFSEEQLAMIGGRRGNWEFHASNPAFIPSTEAGLPGKLETSASGATYNATEFAYWGYQTQGTSDIYQVTVATWAANTGAHIESFIELLNSGGTEKKVLLSTEAEGTTEYADKITSICGGSCLALTGAEHNAVHFQQSVTKPCSGCSFSDSIREGLVYLAENGHATTSYSTAPTIEFKVEKEGKTETVKRANAIYGSGSWLSNFQGALELIAKDSGIGVSDTKLEYESSPGHWEQVVEHNYLEKEDLCQGVQCYPEHREAWTLSANLPNGEDKIRYAAHDAMPGTESLSTEGTAFVKVDHSAPHNIVLKGLPFNNEIREAPYELTAEAVDGEGSTTPSSGIKSIALFVNGHEVGKAGGACVVAKGECRGSARWTINGAELGAGNAAIVVVATDNAGNEARRGELFSVRHSKPVPLGPGSLDLESGNFSLLASDVSLGDGLIVSRAYSSRGLTAGEQGPLGPQWSLSLGSTESLVELGDGSVELTSANGGQSLFLSLGPGEGYEPPLGDSNLSLSAEENAEKQKTAYYLMNSAEHTKVKFTKTAGSTLWVPTVQEGAVATDTVTFKYKTVKEGNATVTEPLEALAAVPSGVSCSWSSLPTEMHPGCRALEFTYASSTTATGESESEWGAYKGRLVAVKFVAYDPATKAMREVPVASYTYDTRGRLRSEWDPRILPALRTTYGYDVAGHITAMTPAGQQSWGFVYGTSANDASDGRLVKLTRAQPAAGASEEEVRSALHEQEVMPSNTAAPTITGSAVVGQTVSASNGSWTHAPFAYAYQWEDCVGVTEPVCTAIPGATNSNYNVQTSDLDHELRVEVTAINGVGAVSARATTAELKPEITEYKSSSPNLIDIAEGNDGKVWFTNALGKIGTVSTTGTINEFTLSEGGRPAGITKGPDGNEWFLNGAGGSLKADKITSGGAVTAYAVGVPGSQVPEGIATGPDGNLWVANAHQVTRLTTSGAVTQFAMGENSGNGRDIIAGPQNTMWFTEFGSSIGKVTMSGAVTEYKIPSGSQGTGIAAGSDGNVWVGENGGRIAKFAPGGSATEYTVAPSSVRVEDVALGPDGNIWFTLEQEATKVGMITPTGAVSLFTPPSGEATGIATGPDGNMWFLVNQAGRILKLGAHPASAPPASPQPGTAIEYDVPVSGPGAPYELSQSAVAAWAQKDDPVEATAVLPPDSPQGWPATGYQRATIYYMDAQGRQVNSTVPSNGAQGAIATTEYNEENEVIRTLTADNRVTALEAGGTSPEVSEELDTQNLYNGEGARESEAPEPGTRLIDVLGPRHEVKYRAGKETKETLARNHEKLFYNQGAPTLQTHEQYDLLTKTTDLAQLINEEEVEVRTTVTSYSGQESAGAPGGLGWKLRAPTSVTIDPEGAKVTHVSIYNETTGQVAETRGPAGLNGGSPHDERTIYYSSEANAEFAGCGGHPEFVGLICETLPAKQPENSRSPKLPVTVKTYNVWNEPTTIEESFGTAMRTTKNTYDEAGRLTSGETTATGTKDSSLPKVSDTYNELTGMLEKQTSGSGAQAKTITSVYNTLGEKTSYTDADGNTSIFKYGSVANDNRLEEMTDGSAEGSTWQRYTYDATTKKLTKLTDSAIGAVTATYDTEGHMTSEVYPNGMCANYRYDSTGRATHLEYLKTTNCGEANPTVWFSEASTPSVHGELVNRTSTLGTQNYVYDTLGRVTEVQETPAGAGCSGRLYGYDEESNRTSQTTRKPPTKGTGCATSGGTVQNHIYDEANRLLDSGVTYEVLGNITKLPAGDAEKQTITTTYYVDGAVATQLQNGLTDAYSLDAEGRVRQMVGTKEKVVQGEVVSHYDGPGAAVAWSGAGAGRWSRNVGGIDGSVIATQTNGEAPILQLSDLQGDTVATAALSSEATKLISTYNSTEFGVPNKQAPPKFAWLGAADVTSERTTGLITEGVTSYVPQIGKRLQAEEVAPPGLPYGAGGGSPYTFQEEPWNMQGAQREAAEAPGLEAGREREAEEAACRADPESCSDDPAWSGDVSIQAADAIAYALGELEVVYYLGGAKLAEKAMEILVEHLGINFLTQLKEAVEKGIFGFSADDVAKWAFATGGLLQTCVEAAHNHVGRPKNPHCWIYQYTVVRHAYKGGPGFEFPNFAIDPTVGYCPWGPYSKCYIVNEW
jgi:streptogramin lyase